MWVSAKHTDKGGDRGRFDYRRREGNVMRKVVYSTARKVDSQQKLGKAKKSISPGTTVLTL